MMLRVHGTMQLESYRPGTYAAHTLWDPDCSILLGSGSYQLVAFWGLLERSILSYS